MNSKKDRIVEKILCIGDVILDSYSKGNVNRISPEAPIPILKIESDKFVLGGSGNVARNICTAGGKCHLLSIVGKDNEAEILKKLSRECKGLTFNFVEDSSRFTTKKKRFVSGQQQILRVDQEITSPINKQIQSKILTIFKKQIDKFNVVVISDYNKGMLVEKLLKEIIKILKQERISTISSLTFNPELTLKKGNYSRVKPNKEDKIDIKKAITTLSRLGKYNFSQGAVVRNRKVVAIEGRGGTQKMLKRCKSKKFRNKGVLVKFPKKKQDLRMDLPAIGLKTLTQCKSAGLKGIVLKSKQNVFLERKKCISFANKNKMFIIAK